METEYRSIDNEELKKQKQKRKGRVFWGGCLFGVLLTLAIGGIFLAGKSVYRIVRSVASGNQSSGGQSATGADETVVNVETMRKIRTIEQVIDEYYYGEEMTDEDLQDGIYKGMVLALDDPYSEYYTKEELDEVIESNQGISYGIGAYISLDKVTGLPLISGVMEGAPAQAAGLREGDLIYEVNGESTQGYSLTKVVNMVKGEENTPVLLKIYREGEPDYLEIEAVRGKLIEVETVNSAMLEDCDHIGYLQIREFDTVTIDQFNEEMAELKASDMKGLILDLRSNPGGDLTAVTEVARRILPAGMITYTEDKYGKRKEYTCNGEYELQVPMVVLVNEYSASASELLAGAIKDHNKGTILGTTTFGKGIVQRITRLDDGTAVKLTVSSYFTPSGLNIHGTGIVPDIELEYDYELAEKEGIDNQVERAIEILEGKINDSDYAQ